MLYRFGQQSTSGKILLCCGKLYHRIRMGQILLAQSWCTFAVFQLLRNSSSAQLFHLSPLQILVLVVSPSRLFFDANCLHSAMLQANTWSALLLVSARSMMVVAALGHGEIHFRLHFEFHLQLTLYFTLNCIFIFSST